MQFRGGATYFRKLMERFSIVVEYSVKVVAALSVVLGRFFVVVAALSVVLGCVVKCFKRYSATVLQFSEPLHTCCRQSESDRRSYVQKNIINIFYYIYIIYNIYIIDLLLGFAGNGIFNCSTVAL